MMIHSFRLSNILYPWKVVSNVGMVILRPGETHLNHDFYLSLIQKFKINQYSITSSLFILAMLAMAVATNEKGDISNIARIANAVPVALYSRVTMIVNIVVLNCQKCNQCLKCQILGHKNFQKI